MPGPMGRRNRGPAQKVENSGQVLKRLFGIIFKKYKFVNLCRKLFYKFINYKKNSNIKN